MSRKDFQKILNESGLNRSQLNAWKEKGLIDNSFLSSRYLKEIKRIIGEDSLKVARLFLKRLRLALQTEKTFSPFWKMTVVIKRYKLEDDFEKWIGGRLGRDEAINKIKINLPGLISFSKLPLLSELHSYLFYYCGLERVKKLEWRDYPRFCYFVDALEKDLPTFDKAIKEIVFLWNAYVWGKFGFFMTGESLSFFDRGSVEKNKNFALALYESVSPEERKIIMGVIKLWIEEKEVRDAPIPLLTRYIECVSRDIAGVFRGVKSPPSLRDRVSDQDVKATREILSRVQPDKTDLLEGIEELKGLLFAVWVINGMCERCECGGEEAPFEVFPEEVARAFIEGRELLLILKEKLESGPLSTKDRQELERDLGWIKTAIYDLNLGFRICCEKHGKIDWKAEEELLNKIKN